MSGFEGLQSTDIQNSQEEHKLQSSESDMKHTQETLENKSPLILECVDTIESGCSNILTIKDKADLQDSLKSQSKNDIRELIATIKETSESFTKSDIFDLLGLTKNTNILNTEKQQIKTRVKNLETLKKLTSGLQRESYSFFTDFLKNTTDFSKINPKELEQIISKLQSSPQAFTQLAQDIQSKNPAEYQNFKQTLIQINPSLEANFQQFEVQQNLEMASLGIDDKNLNIQHIGDTITAIDGEKEISINSNGDRMLGVVGSDYKIDSKLDTKDTEKQIKDQGEQFETDMENIDKEIQGLSKITDILKRVVQEFDNMTEKQQLATISYLNTELPKKFPSLFFTPIQSIEDIKTAIPMIQSKIEELKKEKEKKEKKYKEKVEELLANNARQAREAEKYKMKTLKFLHNIGFDIINKAKTDIIIEYLNRNKGKFQLDTKINFQTGSLGFNKDQSNPEINSAEKLAFIKLFNTMLGGNIVDENIAFGRSVLSIKARSEIQKLNNNLTGTFQENLMKTVDRMNL